MSIEYTVEPVSHKGHYLVRVTITAWEDESDVFYTVNEFELETIGL